MPSLRTHQRWVSRPKFLELVPPTACRCRPRAHALGSRPPPREVTRATTGPSSPQPVCGPSSHPSSHRRRAGRLLHPQARASQTCHPRRSDDAPVGARERVRPSAEMAEMASAAAAEPSSASSQPARDSRLRPELDQAELGGWDGRLAPLASQRPRLLSPASRA